jgi:hypothetical protein
MENRENTGEQELIIGSAYTRKVINRQLENGRPFDPSDLSSDGIEPDGTLNERYAEFWRGE